MDVLSVRSQLEAQLAELQVRARKIEADLAAPHSADSEEAAVEREGDEALEGQDALVAHEIRAVRGALARIEAGTWGDCVTCGMPIAAGRLAAMPEAAQCIGCASKAEAH